jgi:hypothetical protein
MSKRFAAVIIAAGLASGCSGSVPTPESSPAPAAATDSQTAVASADLLPSSSHAKQLDATLASLKSTLDEGNLTGDEYSSARASEIKGFCESLSHFQINAQSLHDEVGYLAQMNREHRLSDEEFKQTKSVVVRRYFESGK